MRTKRILFTILLAGLVLISCKNQTIENPVMKLIDENPSSINWNHDNRKNQVESYTADISVYTMDSRKGTELTLDNKYRITTKPIMGDTYFKIDIPNEYSVNRAKSYYYNSNFMVISDSVTGVIENKFKLDKQNINNDLDFLTNINTFSKINISKVLETSQRLSFDVNNEGSKYMEINLPSKYFSDDFSQRISTKMCFDKNQETLTQIEIVEIDEDGRQITTTVMPVYDFVDGIPVKIAEVTTIDTFDPNAIEVENPYGYSSIDDIPEIDEEEAERLMEEGVLFDSLDYDFGLYDTTNYTETIVELYESIEINNVEDAVFKVLMEM